MPQLPPVPEDLPLCKSTHQIITQPDPDTPLSAYQRVPSTVGRLPDISVNDYYASRANPLSSYSVVSSTPSREAPLRNVKSPYPVTTVEDDFARQCVPTVSYSQGGMMTTRSLTSTASMPFTTPPMTSRSLPYSPPQPYPPPQHYLPPQAYLQPLDFTQTVQRTQPVQYLPAGPYRPSAASAPPIFAQLHSQPLPQVRRDLCSVSKSISEGNGREPVHCYLQNRSLYSDSSLYRRNEGSVFPAPSHVTSQPYRATYSTAHPYASSQLYTAPQSRTAGQPYTAPQSQVLGHSHVAPRNVTWDSTFRPGPRHLVCPGIGVNVHAAETAGEVRPLSARSNRVRFRPEDGETIRRACQLKLNAINDAGLVELGHRECMAMSHGFRLPKRPDGVSSRIQSTAEMANDEVSLVPEMKLPTEWVERRAVLPERNGENGVRYRRGHHLKGALVAPPPAIVRREVSKPGITRAHSMASTMSILSKSVSQRFGLGIEAGG